MKRIFILLAFTLFALSCYPAGIAQEIDQPIEENSREQDNAVIGQEIVLPDLGIVFTLPADFAFTKEFSILNAENEDANILIQVFLEDDASFEILYRKVIDKSNGLIWEEKVEIGDYSYFVYHDDTMMRWHFILTTPEEPHICFGFYMSETQSETPKLALDVVRSLRILDYEPDAENVPAIN